ncbi:peptidoglycan recognition protein family protein [Belnapia moabensis]|uniref:peptidoglycan recognition protein family protein n=1 Tax=Belnapia moabensis TaxID=365533 RepID=UPI0005BCD897|nr:N-acetylmuramoyl-L-alanine amidase [Belnapia moabensis]
MAFSLTWLPEVLLAADLKVAEHPGWASRGRGEFGRPEGVMWHHTATTRLGNMPSLHTLVEGRSDLPGPLCHLGLARDGTYYVIAAGRANHAGGGDWKTIRDGNGRFIGIEAEHSGRAGDPWPDVQIDAYIRGTAALLKHIGRGADRCCGHGEYALPFGRKNDPRLDGQPDPREAMDRHRKMVQAAIDGHHVPRPLIPQVDAESRPTLRRGDRGDDVRAMQGKLGLAVDGIFGPATEVRVRQFQRDKGLVADGILGPKSWAALDTA